MAKRFLGRVIFLRHGQTEYTDVFPDITSKGVETITKSANLIKTLLGSNPNIAIASSPMPRALGSAAIIARTVGYVNKIHAEVSIQGAIAKDKKLGQALKDEHVAKGGVKALDMAYITDPRYENNPDIIEPRSKVRRRFLEYLAKLVEVLLTKHKLPLNIICVSHYEVLYHFVENLFKLDYEKDETLGHGEIIVVSISDTGIKNTSIVEMKVTFRNRTTKKFFDYKNKK